MSISVTFESGNTDPRIVRIRTTSTFADVITAGWYKQTPPNQLVPSDKVEIYYGEGSGSAANGFFDVSISAGVVTLSVAESDVVLPVTDGHFANFSGTSGAIADLGYVPSDPAKTVVSMVSGATTVDSLAVFADVLGTLKVADGPVTLSENLTLLTGSSLRLDSGDLTVIGSATITGNIIGGDSGGGSPGDLILWPSTAANGSLRLSPTNAGADFNTIITNGTMAQSTTYTIPDPANAAAKFLVGATATPFTSGNFPVASGNGGLMVDSGLAAANIQNKTNIKAATTANIGGGGAGPISVVVAGLTAASVVVGTIESSSNAVQVQTITATATGFDVTFTGDPGASCLLNYVAFIAAQ